MSLEYAADGQSVFGEYLGGYESQWTIPEGILMGVSINIYDMARQKIPKELPIGQEMRRSEKMDAGDVSPLGNEVASG